MDGHWRKVFGILGTCETVVSLYVYIRHITVCHLTISINFRFFFRGLVFNIQSGNTKVIIYRGALISHGCNSFMDYMVMPVYGKKSFLKLYFLW